MSASMCLACGRALADPEGSSCPGCGADVPVTTAVQGTRRDTVEVPPDQPSSTDGERTGRLVVVRGPDAGRRHTFVGWVDIGRAGGGGFQLRDDGVSGRHARISAGDTGFSVEDLESTNGTFVNDVPVKGPTPARFGDRLRLGSTVLVLNRVDPAEDRLATHERMETLGRLGAAVAHDLNGLLAITLTCGELGRTLLEGERPTAEDLSTARECFADVIAAATNGKALASQILNFARRTPVASDVVDLSSIVSETIDLARRTLPRAVAVGRAIEPGLFVVGDAGQLRQVVMNLLLNARDAMPAGGRVTVRLSAVPPAEAAPAGTVLLAAEDSGTGMDLATRERIFEPFFTTKERSRGTGLGLSTVLSVVNQHGGTVECESELGRGTTFRIRLPARASTSGQLVPARSTRPLPLARASHRTTVLLVEDDDVLRRATARILRASDFDVVEASDGSMCLERVRAEPRAFDVAIVDLDLPGLDGVSLQRELRASAPALRVIVWSGFCDNEQRSALVSSGVREILEKPVVPAELVRVVRRTADGLPAGTR